MRGHRSACRYVAQANGDYHSLVNCHAAENLLNPWCRKAGPTVRFIMYVRMASITTTRQVFPVYSNGTITSAIGTESEPYDASKLEIMTARPGYGAVSENADSKALMRTYALPVYMVADQKLVAVIAVERTNAESCTNGCVMNSYVLPAAYQLASLVQRSNLAYYLGDPTSGTYLFTHTDTTKLLSSMVATMASNDYGQNEALLFASADGSVYYEVVNCLSLSNLDNLDCKLAGADTKYIAMFSDKVRYNPAVGPLAVAATSVALSDAGTVGKYLRNLTTTPLELSVLSGQKYGFTGSDFGMMVATVTNPLSTKATGALPPVGYVGAKRSNDLLFTLIIPLYHHKITYIYVFYIGSKTPSCATTPYYLY